MATPTFQLFRSSTAVESFQAGDTIFSAGDTGDCMYGVQEGEVDLYVSGRVVETVGPDGIFGEMALIDHQPRSATAIARTDAVLAKIDEPQFDFMTRNTPNFALNMLRLVSARLRNMDSA